MELLTNEFTEMCYFEKKLHKHAHFYTPLKCWDLIFRFFYSKNKYKKLKFLIQNAQFKNTFNDVKIVSIP